MTTLALPFGSASTSDLYHACPQLSAKAGSDLPPTELVV